MLMEKNFVASPRGVHRTNKMNIHINSTTLIFVGHKVKMLQVDYE